ncbi:MAG: Gfo/Idh/MocA family oxidoreductase [Anaerolineae bacterium]|nr:Gfo/Idh/MocA family oxidoreductase [Anaerolineae bacterium]
MNGLQRFDDTYGHTPIRKAFEEGDVYGVAYDSTRAALKPIRLGVIGAGGVAQSKYFPAVARLRMIWEPVEISAFAEPRTEHVDKVQAIYGGQAYADYREMLRAEPLDGVMVLSPDGLHREHVLACIEAGLPVLVEKHIARSLADAVQICEAADAAKLLMMTVANKRYSPPYRRARTLLDRGAVGAPALMTGKFNLGYNYVDLLEAGTIHLFDLTLYLMGAVTRVNAAGMKRKPGGDYPIDNAVVMLEFASGAVGSLTTSATALSLKPWERVEIYGEHAWLSVEDQYALTLYGGEVEGAQSWRPVVPNTQLFDEEFGGYMGIVENFCQCIRGEETPLVTGWDGCRAYELLTAVHLSLARRTPVDLPLPDPAAADAEVYAWLKRS